VRGAVGADEHRPPGASVGEEGEGGEGGCGGGCDGEGETGGGCGGEGGVAPSTGEG